MVHLTPLRVHADVVGYTADTTNSGWFSNQTELLPTEVSDPHFGQQYKVTVTGQVLAQPLIAADRNGRSVMVVATESNDVYALDPDDQSVPSYWHVNLGQGNKIAPAWAIGSRGTAFPNCTDIKPTVGVTATPVVDAATHTVYLTSKVPNDTNPSDLTGVKARYLFHALDLATGTEQPGFPYVIAGNGTNAPGLAFDATHQLQRPGLVLMNGVVYAAFGSHCDNAPYEGWVVGLATYKPTNPNPGVVTMWNDEPNDDRQIPCTQCGAGIWMSGVAPASDGSGQLIVVTGNGDLSMTAGTPIDGHSPPPNGSFGQSVVRLGVQPDGSLAPTDFYTPQSAPAQNQNDTDLGSGGAVVLPASYGTSSHAQLVQVIGKDGRLTTLDASSLGGWSGGSAPSSDRVVSRTNLNGGTWGRPGAWPGDGGWIYVDHTGGDSTQPLSSGIVALQRSLDQSGAPQFVIRGGSSASDTFAYTSGPPVISSSATGVLTAVLWVTRIDPGTPSASELIAYDPIPDANGVLQPLFRKGVGSASKFTSPAIDHGHVYIATKDGNVFGFWSSAPPAFSETPVVFTAPTDVGSTQTVHAILTASRDVTVTGLSIPSPFQAGTPTPALGTPIASGSTIDVPVTFAPTIAGDVRSKLTVTLSDGSTLRVGVDAIGRQPAAHLSAPAALDFGSVAWGQTATKPVLVSNDGTASLTITNVVPPAGPRFTAGPLPTGKVLNPGDSVAIPVNFASSQSQPGANSDSMTIATSANSATISLTASATPPAVLTVSPGLNVEANTPVGTPVTLSFSIKNTGGTATTISKSKPPGSADFQILTPLLEGTPLAVNQTINLQVQFTPSTPGVETATWTINADSANNGSIVMTLGGRGLHVVGTDSAALVYQGEPHDWYYDATFGALRHAWQAGGAWHVETLDGTGSVATGAGQVTDKVGKGVSVTLYNGQPHVWYQDLSTASLRHAWWDGRQWRFESLDGRGAGSAAGRTQDNVGPSTASVVYAGAPHVWYADTTASSLRHAWWTGTQWSFETLDGTGSAGGPAQTHDAVGMYPAVTLFGGGPHVWYADSSANSLRHAWWNGSQWSFETLDGNFATPWSGGQTSDAVGTYSAVTLYGGLPHVWYADTTSNSLRHAWWTGTQWSFETLDGAGSTPHRPGQLLGDSLGTYVSAALYNGVPHIWYADVSTNTLRHAWWAGTQWSFETLDGNGAAPWGNGQTQDAVGTYSAAVVTDTPNVWYYDSTAYTLRHAVWTGATWTFEVVDGG